MTLRVARPTNQLQRIAEIYMRGLGFEQLARFENHDGFDGIILGHPHAPYHLEFTHHRGTVVPGAPSQDHLLVFYLPDTEEWQQTCLQMEGAGFSPVSAYNPYWDVSGKTFEDPEGYRIVLQRAAWTL